jgi:integrase
LRNNSFLKDAGIVWRTLGSSPLVGFDRFTTRHIADLKRRAITKQVESQNSVLLALDSILRHRLSNLITIANARKRNGAKKNGFIRTDNYRARVLKKLAKDLELPKLNFQVLRRTIATLAQTKGGVKDVQGVLGHSKADTTVNVYMQPIEAGVKQTLDAIYAELTTPEMRPSL